MRGWRALGEGEERCLVKEVENQVKVHFLKEEEGVFLHVGKNQAHDPISEGKLL